MKDYQGITFYVLFDSGPCSSETHNSQGISGHVEKVAYFLDLTIYMYTSIYITN